MLPTFSISALNLLIIVRKFLIRFFESVSYLSLILMIILSLQALFFLAFFVPHNFWMKDSFCGSEETEIFLLSRYVYVFPSIDLYSRVSFNIFRSWTRFDVIVVMVTVIAYQILSFCRDSLCLGWRMVYQRNVHLILRCRSSVCAAP